MDQTVPPPAPPAPQTECSASHQDAASTPEHALPETAAAGRQGRRFEVGINRGKARSRVRYIEGSLPKGGCRFL